MNYFINDPTKKSLPHILNTKYFLYARKSTDVEDKPSSALLRRIAICDEIKDFDKSGTSPLH